MSTTREEMERRLRNAASPRQARALGTVDQQARSLSRPLGQGEVVSLAQRNALRGQGRRERPVQPIPVSRARQPQQRRGLLSAGQIGQDFSSALNRRATSLGASTRGVDNTGRPLRAGGDPARARGAFSSLGNDQEALERKQAVLRDINNARRSLAGGITPDERRQIRRLGEQDPALARQFLTDIGAGDRAQTVAGTQRRQQDFGLERDRLAADVTRRGQDIGLEREGLAQETTRRGQDVTAAGQALAFAGSQLDRQQQQQAAAQAARQFEAEFGGERGAAVAETARSIGESLFPDDPQRALEVQGFAANSGAQNEQDAAALANAQPALNDLFQKARNADRGVFARLNPFGADVGNLTSFQDLTAVLDALSPQKRDDLIAENQEAFRRFSNLRERFGG